MDFGRLTSVDAVRFTLPDLDPRSDAAVGGRAAGARPTVRIGAPAWASRDFARKVYPKGTKSGDYLARYAEHYNAVELNATFHRLPHASTIDAWCSATPDSFRFCPKFHRSVTDRLDDEGVRHFASVVARFGARLGPMLLQLPPSFSPGHLGELERVLDVVGERAVAIEVRHRGWFQAGRLLENAFRALASRGATAVITDTAGRRDVCHASVTSRTVFVRFQGNELHATDAERIDAWTGRIAQMIERGVTDVYFFVHQPDDKSTPETLAMLAERIRGRLALDAVPSPDGPLFGGG